MKVSIIDLDPTRKKLHVEIPAQRVKAELDRKYRDLAKQVRIKGFRPGKVPRQILKSYYGKSIENEVSNQFVQDTYPEALKQAQLKPLAEAELDDVRFEDSGTLVYDATVEVRPPFSIEDYKGLELKRRAVEISEEQTQKELELVRDRHAQLKTPDSDRPIREKDFVVVDFTPFLEGKVFDKGKAVDYMLEVGKKSFHPDFDEHLLGHEAGEILGFDLDYPDNSPTAEVAGKRVHMEVVIKEVKEKILPDLDDDFAKEAGDYENLEALRSDIRTRLEKVEHNKLEMELRELILGRLTEKVPLELPQKALEREVDQLIDQFRYQFQSQGLNVDPSAFNTPEIRAEYRAQAERNLRSRLILEQIAEQEQMSLGEDELEELYREAGRLLRKDVHSVRTEYADSPLLDQLKQNRLHDKVWKLLIEEAHYTDATPERSADAGTQQE
jgi:trigger factor